MNDSSVALLLEARLATCWRPVRIVRFPNVRFALNSLSLFARQQGVDCNDVRVKTLLTEQQLTFAKRAVAAYHRNPRTGVGE